MTSFSEARQQIELASSVPELMAAACDAFQEILNVLRDHYEPDSGWFAALVLAGSPAGEGRDALLFAPSLPPHTGPRKPAREFSGGDGRAGSGAIAAGVASLAGLLAVRLAGAAAGTAEADHRDLAACRQAAASARELAELLGGAGP